MCSVDTGGVSGPFKGHTGTIRSVSFQSKGSSDSSTILASVGAGDNVPRIWDVHSGMAFFFCETFYVHLCRVVSYILTLLLFTLLSVCKGDGRYALQIIKCTPSSSFNFHDINSNPNEFKGALDSTKHFFF